MTDKRDDNPNSVIVRADVSVPAMVRSCVVGLWTKIETFDLIEPRQLLWPTLFGVTITFIPGPGFTAPLSAQRFATLAQHCAPSVSLGVLRAVARTESHFEPLALRDNTQGLARTSRTVAGAVSQARRWLAAGDSVDLGLMQINATNLPELGLTLSTALDPCRSLSGAAAILRAAYARGASVADSQAALLIALSRYNTGRPLDGIVNGYVGKVLAPHRGNAAAAEPSPPARTASNSVPAWDLWANAAYARVHGASWLVAESGRPEPPATEAAVLATTPAQIYPTATFRDDRRSP